MTEDVHNKSRVFVYGSLKAGHGNHVLLDNDGAEYLGRHSYTGRVRMVSCGGFPAVVLDPSQTNESTVYGEVYLVTPEVLSSLDALEGHPRWYVRHKFMSDQGLRAWMYTFNPSQAGDRPVVKDGMWMPNDAEKKHWQEKMTA